MTVWELEMRKVVFESSLNRPRCVRLECEKAKQNSLKQSQTENTENPVYFTVILYSLRLQWHRCVPRAWHEAEPLQSENSSSVSQSCFRVWVTGDLCFWHLTIMMMFWKKQLHLRPRQVCICHKLW